MKCVACNKEGTKKDFLFTEDKQAYCVNPFQCNEEHPNSVPNIIARGSAVRMYTEDELETSLFDRLEIPEELKDRIMKVATKPQSIRLSKLDIALYLIQLQEQKELSSISEAVRWCVSLAMKLEPIQYVAPHEPNQGMVTLVPEPEPEPSFEDITTPEPEPAITEIRKGVKVVSPKVNAKDLIMNQIDKKDEEQEEEFTF